MKANDLVSLGGSNPHLVILLTLYIRRWRDRSRRGGLAASCSSCRATTRHYALRSRGRGQNRRLRGAGGVAVRGLLSGSVGEGSVAGKGPRGAEAGAPARERKPRVKSRAPKRYERGLLLNLAFHPPNTKLPFP